MFLLPVIQLIRNPHVAVELLTADLGSHPAEVEDGVAPRGLGNISSLQRKIEWHMPDVDTGFVPARLYWCGLGSEHPGPREFVCLPEDVIAEVLLVPEVVEDELPCRGIAINKVMRVKGQDEVGVEDEDPIAFFGDSCGLVPELAAPLPLVAEEVAALIDEDDVLVGPCVGGFFALGPEVTSVVWA